MRTILTSLHPSCECMSTRPGTCTQLTRHTWRRQVQRSTRRHAKAKRRVNKDPSRGQGGKQCYQAQANYALTLRKRRAKEEERQQVTYRRPYHTKGRQQPTTSKPICRQPRKEQNLYIRPWKQPTRLPREHRNTQLHLLRPLSRQGRLHKQGSRQRNNGLPAKATLEQPNKGPRPRRPRT